MNDVPQLPRHLGLEDVKGLIRMQLTIALEVTEETVVGIPVPLKKKEEVSSRRAMGWSAAAPGSHPPLRTRGGGEGPRQTPERQPFTGIDSRLLLHITALT